MKRYVRHNNIGIQRAMNLLDLPKTIIYFGYQIGILVGTIKTRSDLQFTVEGRNAEYLYSQLSVDDRYEKTNVEYMDGEEFSCIFVQK